MFCYYAVVRLRNTVSCASKSADSQFGEHDSIIEAVHSIVSTYILLHTLQCTHSVCVLYTILTEQGKGLFFNYYL